MSQIRDTNLEELEDNILFESEMNDDEAISY